MDYGVDPLNAKLNPICHLLALLQGHHILHISRISVNRMLISVIMEIFIMVCPSLPRAVSKCVLHEQGDYLNYNDLSPTKLPVNN